VASSSLLDRADPRSVRGFRTAARGRRDRLLHGGDEADALKDELGSDQSSTATRSDSGDVASRSGSLRTVLDPKVDTISVLFYLLLVKIIAAAKFKQQCLAILDRVDEEGIVITKHGRPVARLTRIPRRENDADLIGSLRGQVAIKGDILSTGVAWHAER